MQFRKVISLAMALILAIVPLTLSASASESSIRNKISEYDKKGQALQNQINALSGDKAKYVELKEKLEEQVNNTEQQIDLINEQIRKLQTEIDALNLKVAEKEQEMETTKELFKKRLRAMYVAGDNSDLRVILSAQDFGDFLARAELMRGITEHDTQMLEKLKADLDIINQSKQRIQENKAETDQMKQTLVEKQTELDRQYTEAETALNEINAKQSDLESEQAKVQAAKNKLDAELRAAISAESGSDRVYTGEFAWPFPGGYEISSPYGWRSRGFHTGTDITRGAAYGRPLVAAADGKVIHAGNNGSGYGNYVAIDHGRKNGDQYSTLYAHCSSLAVSYGQTVKKGQVIAYCGSTGNSTGPHLHFEIRVNGEHTNPMNYFSKIG